MPTNAQAAAAAGMRVLAVPSMIHRGSAAGFDEPSPGAAAGGCVGLAFFHSVSEVLYCMSATGRKMNTILSYPTDHDMDQTFNVLPPTLDPGLVQILPSLLAFSPPAYGLPPFSDLVEGVIPLDSVFRIKGTVVKGFGRGSKVGAGG
jgi:hypothetical protein